MKLLKQFVNYAAAVQERVAEVKTHKASNVRKHGEPGVDPGALRDLHRGVKHDLEAAVGVRGEHSAGGQGGGHRNVSCTCVQYLSFRE